MNEKTFRDILLEICEQKHLTPMDLYNACIANGMKSSYQATLNYYNGKTKPTLRKAKQMMEILQYDITEVELLASLLRESQQKQVDKYVKTITLLLSDYHKDTVEQLEKQLEERYKKIDAKNFNEYVNKLIKNDLEK